MKRFFLILTLLSVTKLYSASPNDIAHFNEIQQNFRCEDSTKSSHVVYQYQSKEHELYVDLIEIFRNAFQTLRLPMTTTYQESTEWTKLNDQLPKIARELKKASNDLDYCVNPEDLAQVESWLTIIRATPEEQMQYFSKILTSATNNDDNDN